MRTHTHSRYKRSHPPAPCITRSIDTDDDTPVPQRGGRKPVLLPKLEGLQLSPGLPPGACQGSAATAINVARLSSIFRGKPWAGCLTPPTVLPQRSQQ